MEEVFFREIRIEKLFRFGSFVFRKINQIKAIRLQDGVVCIFGPYSNVTQLFDKIPSKDLGLMRKRGLRWFIGLNPEK